MYYLICCLIDFAGPEEGPFFAWGLVFRAFGSRQIPLTLPSPSGSVGAHPRVRPLAIGQTRGSAPTARRTWHCTARTAVALGRAGQALPLQSSLRPEEAVSTTIMKVVQPNHAYGGPKGGIPSSRRTNPLTGVRPDTIIRNIAPGMTVYRISMSREELQ